MKWPWKWPWAAMVRNFWRRARCVAEACLRKEGLAFVALMVSLGAAGVLSLFLYGNLRFLRAQGAIDQIFYLSAGMLLLIGIVLMSSHRLLGSKQAIEAEILGLKLRMNQNDTPAAPEVEP